MLTCTGHGTCIDPFFPYGQCSVDLANYEADALYTPFIPVTAASQDTVQMFTVTNTYFIVDASYVFPTPKPTGIPTSTPTQMPTVEPSTGTPTTKIPTNFPTTGTPTHKPTTGTPTTSPTHVKVRLFDSGIYMEYPNNYPFTTLQSSCAAQANTLGYSSCTSSNSAPFLCYEDGIHTLETLPSIMGFPSDSPVVGLVSGIVISTEYSAMFGSSVTLSNSMVSAGVYSESTGVWTGCYITGGCFEGACSACNSWDFNADANFGDYGSAVATSNFWVYYDPSSPPTTPFACNDGDPFPFTCACIY